MSILLCIDSATTHASVAIAKDGKVLGMKRNEIQKDHAAFIQPAITALLEALSLDIKSIAAVCVSEGPGSYTGLRVGMASAKGICYALNIPLMTIPTTAIMAYAAVNNAAIGKNDLIIPMIDARRMEVFSAVYNAALECLEAPQPKLLDEASYQEWLSESVVHFTGSGTDKWKTICKDSNARFITDSWSAADMATMAESMFNKKQFSSLAYAAPQYSKDFYTPAKKESKS